MAPILNPNNEFSNPFPTLHNKKSSENIQKLNSFLIDQKTDAEIFLKSLGLDPKEYPIKNIFFKASCSQLFKALRTIR